MSATTAHRPQQPQHVSFAASDLRQSTLKKNMSITQTYYLAHKARGKLSREAARSDHDLRLLVGHANLLDSLMLELADAEREQERWFNQSVRHSTPAKERHIQFAETTIAEEDEDESEDDVYDSDSSDDDFEDDVVMTAATLPTVVGKPGAAAAPKISTAEIHVDDIMEDDLEEDYAQLELVRTSSHSNASPPPELVDESDSSEDESMPPSPPEAILDLPETKKEQESLYDDHEEYEYLPRERTPIGVASAISVY